MQPCCLELIAKAKLPTPWGDFIIVGFEESDTKKDHIALIFGNIPDNGAVLCRIHSECLTGDALFSLRCDCGFQLEAALARIAEEGSGVLLYHRQEGRKQVDCVGQGAMHHPAPIYSYSLP